MEIVCNIDKAERRHRIVIGIFILLAALLGFGKIFFSILGIVMALEGLIGWCGIPVIVEKLNFKDKFYS